MKRAVEIGPVDAAAIKTAGGKVRLRLLFTVEQLQALLAAATDDDDDVKRSVTQCNAPESEKRRTEDDDGGDARCAKRVFVREGTPAWDAWITHRQTTSGNPNWYLTVQHTEGGRRVTGWWFPSLFPPGQQQLSEEDEQELAQGLK